MPSWIRAAAGVVGASLLPLLFVYGWLVPRSNAKIGVPSPDTYGYTVPMWREAQRAWENGYGLFWSESQNAGQPLLELPSSGLLYPPTWLLTILELPALIEWWIVFHLALAGGGAWLLARAIGQTRSAACVTAVAVQVASPAPFLALWVVTILSGYALMPLALFVCERLLQRRDAGSACALALVLTLQCASGFPQVLAFTCELVGLRMIWELLTVPDLRRPRSLAWVVASPVLFLLFAAIQIVPALAVFEASVRAIPLSSGLIDSGGIPAAFDRLQETIGARSWQAGIFGTTCTLAGVALARRESRRIAGFYALAAALFIGLVADSPVRDLYRNLPFVGTLRGSIRFVWVASLCLCVLTGFAVDALARARSPGRLAAVAAGGLLGAFGFQLLSDPGWTLPEAAGAALALTLAALAARLPRPALTVSLVALAALGAAVYPSLRDFPLRLMPNLEELYTAREAFETLQRRTSDQHRVVIFPSRRAIGGDLGVIEKSASLYDLRAIADYEHLTTLRYATFYSYLTSRTRIETAGDWIRALGETPTSRPLLNLLGARFVITGRAPLEPFRPMTPIGPTRTRYRLLENPRALPRAHFAPRAEVVDDEEATLARLASPRHDPRRSVLLASPPRDGWLGERPPAGRRGGYVGMASSQGETVVLRVDADVPGFAVLTDQFAPGWTATVDGEPAEVLRANHAFRAVRVPAGRSTVRFVYRPDALYRGAAVSGAALLALVLLSLRARRATRT